jgi:hypothetical protein
MQNGNGEYCGNEILKKVCLCPLKKIQKVLDFPKPTTGKWNS